MPADADELRRIVDGLGGVDATGHRFVHGGDRFTGPVRIDGDVRDAIARCATSRCCTRTRRSGPWTP